MCTLEVQGCVTACKGDSGCQSACTANKPCGASNPTRVNTTSTSGSHTSQTSPTTSTGSVTYDSNGFAITGTPPAGGNGKPNAASRLLEVGSVYGMGLLVAGVVAGVAIVGV